MKIAKILALSYCLALSGDVLATPTPAIAPEYEQLLEQLVNINSDTRNPEGLQAVRVLLVPHFEKLGLVSSVHELKDGRRLLSFEAGASQPKILLIGHLDTVFPATGSFLRLRREGKRLIGPGVIDMKGGVVLLLNALGELKREGRMPAVRVVLNDDEEIGSPYSKLRLRELAHGMRYGLVFEPGLEDGAVVKGQAGVRWFKLTVRGRAAHAGLEPQNGTSACVELAHKLIQVAGLTRLERGLSLNPGVIEGGTKPNIVCEQASSTVDVRFQNPADLAYVRSEMERIGKHSTLHNANLGEGTHSGWTQIAELPLLPEERTQELVQVAQSVAKGLGQNLPARTVGYGSDGNNLADNGIPLLVGLGPYGGGLHTDHEFLDTDGYARRLLLVKDLLVKLGEK